MLPAKSEGKKAKKKVLVDLAKEVLKVEGAPKHPAPVLPALKTVEKVAEKVIMKEEKKEGLSGVFSAFSGIVNKISEIASSEGVQTLISLAPAILLSDEYIRERMYAKDPLNPNILTTIPAGTILYSNPISAQMFDDPNDRTQKLMSVYSYYTFQGTVNYKASQGDLVNGLLGMFIVPDPDQVVDSSDPVVVDRLVREYNGAIGKLNKDFSIKIPPATTALHVQEGLEPRLAQQGVLYVVAFTDIDVTDELGEISISYVARMAEPANTGLTVAPIVNVPFADLTISALTVSTSQQLVVLNYDTSVGVNGMSVTGGILTAPAGAYIIMINIPLTQQFVAAANAVFAEFSFIFADVATSAVLNTYSFNCPGPNGASGQTTFYNFTDRINFVYDSPWTLTVNVIAGGSLSNGPIHIVGYTAGTLASSIGIIQSIVFASTTSADAPTIKNAKNVHSRMFFKDIKVVDEKHPAVLRSNAGIRLKCAAPNRRVRVLGGAASSGVDLSRRFAANGSTFAQILARRSISDGTAVCGSCGGPGVQSGTIVLCNCRSLDPVTPGSITSSSQTDEQSGSLDT